MMDNITILISLVIFFGPLFFAIKILKDLTKIYEKLSEERFKSFELELANGRLEFKNELLLKELERYKRDGSIIDGEELILTLIKK